MANEVIVIGGDISLLEDIDGELSLDIERDGTMGIFTPVYPDAYVGPTTFTPSTETQTIDCGNLVVMEDITIEPIPQNYGLITWNGSILTVS